MADIFNGKMKYLFLVPIIMIIAFAWLNRMEITNLRNEFFHELKGEKQAEIDQLADLIDKEVALSMEFRKDDYEVLLTDYITNPRNSRNIFAALYDRNLNAVSINRIESDARDFDPLLFDNFYLIARNRQSGWVDDLTYHNGQIPDAPIHIYYRWVPNSPYTDDRFLLTIGVAHESLAIDPGRLLTMGMIIQMVVTFVINMIFVFLLCYLGKIYRSRSGAKWRAEL